LSIGTRVKIIMPSIDLLLQEINKTPVSIVAIMYLANNITFLILMRLPIQILLLQEIDLPLYFPISELYLMAR